MKKKEIVKRLIDDDVDTIHSGEAENYLIGILENGFGGYKNMSKKELENEYNERIPAENV